MKILLFKLSIFFTILTLPVAAQIPNQSYIDSLERSLADSEGKERVVILKELGWEYRITGPQKSLDYSKEALDLARKINHTELQATILNVMGVTHSFLGNYDKSLEYHLEALKIREERRDTLGLGASYNNIGIVYQKLEDYNKALEYFLEALKIKEHIGNKGAIAVTMNNIGMCYRKLDSLDLALAYHEKALEINESINYQEGLSLSYSNLGLIYKEEKEFDKAILYSEKSLELREKTIDYQGIAIQRYILGAIYIETGDYKNAGENLDQAFAIAAEYQFRPIIKDVYLEYSKLHKMTKDYENALKYFEEFAALRDSLLDEKKSKQLLALQVRYENERNELKIQNLELDKQTSLRNYLLIISGLTLLAAFLLLSRYRFKAKATKSLKETQEFNSALISNLPQYVAVHVDGKIVFANKIVRDLFGITEEDLNNKTIFDFVDKKYLHLVRENMERRLKGEDVADYEIEIYSKTGEKRIVNTKGSVIQYKDKEAILVVLNDITELKKVEQEIIAAKEEAEISNKLKSEFLAQMSHEIRSPINNILNFTNLIKDEISDKTNDTVRTSFNSIFNASKRVIRTIDQILNVSELQAGGYDYSPKNIDLYSDCLIPLYEELKNNADVKDLGFNLLKETDETLITADEYSINQIFVNLIENAIKYTSEGEINMIIKTTAGNKICVEVHDTGIGISDEYLPYLFEPFTQEEQGYTRKFEGTGLGLTLVKNYCDLNNARIEVESEKGAGSVFRVIFN